MSSDPEVGGASGWVAGPGEQGAAVLDGPQWPSVTVVVPVHGDRGLLRRTTDALAAQDYPGPVDVLIVDNGDNTELAAASAVLPNGRVVTESTPGSYAARNAALASATGEVLAFTDGDCRPVPGWLREGVSALLADGGPTFVGGAVHVEPADPQRPTFAELWDSRHFLQQEDYVRLRGWAATANMITRRETLDAVGPFNASLKSGGDREWGERASRAGVHAVYAPAAVVEHPARASMRELHRKARRVTRGDVDTRRRTGEPMFEPGVLRASLAPSTRSTVRRAAGFPTRSQGARYVLVAHWMRYYFLGAKLAHVLRTSRTTERPS